MVVLPRVRQPSTRRHCKLTPCPESPCPEGMLASPDPSRCTSRCGSFQSSRRMSAAGNEVMRGAPPMISTPDLPILPHMPGWMEPSAPMPTPLHEAASPPKTPAAQGGHIDFPCGSVSRSARQREEGNCEKEVLAKSVDSLHENQSWSITSPQQPAPTSPSMLSPLQRKRRACTVRLTKLETKHLELLASEGDTTKKSARVMQTPKGSLMASPRGLVLQLRRLEGADTRDTKRVVEEYNASTNRLVKKIGHLQQLLGSCGPLLADDSKELRYLNSLR